MTYGRTRVFIGGLEPVITKEDIEKEFGKFGKLENVWVAQNPPGFAFIVYNEQQDAEDAVDKMNGQTFMGGKLRVEHSRPKPPGARRGGYGGGPPRRDGGGGGGGYMGVGGGGGGGAYRNGRGSYGGGAPYGGGRSQGPYGGGPGGDRPYGGGRPERRDYGGDRSMGGGRANGRYHDSGDSYGESRPPRRDDGPRSREYKSGGRSPPRRYS